MSQLNDSVMHKTIKLDRKTNEDLKKYLSSQLVKKSFSQFVRELIAEKIYKNDK